MQGEFCGRLKCKKPNRGVWLFVRILWGGRWDSNPRRQESQSWTLPTELRPPLKLGTCCGSKSVGNYTRFCRFWQCGAIYPENAEGSMEPPIPLRHKALTPLGYGTFSHICRPMQVRYGSTHEFAKSGIFRRNMPRCFFTYFASAEEILSASICYPRLYHYNMFPNVSHSQYSASSNVSGVNTPRRVSSTSAGTPQQDARVSRSSYPVSPRSETGVRSRIVSPAAPSPLALSISSLPALPLSTSSVRTGTTTPGTPQSPSSMVFLRGEAGIRNSMLSPYAARILPHLERGMSSTDRAALFKMIDHLASIEDKDYIDTFCSALEKYKTRIFVRDVPGSATLSSERGGRLEARLVMAKDDIHDETSSLTYKASILVHEGRHVTQIGEGRILADSQPTELEAMHLQLGFMYRCGGASAEELELVATGKGDHNDSPEEFKQAFGPGLAQTGEGGDVIRGFEEFAPKSAPVAWTLPNDVRLRGIVEAVIERERNAWYDSKELPGRPLPSSIVIKRAPDFEKLSNEQKIALVTYHFPGAILERQTPSAIVDAAGNLPAWAKWGR